MLSQFQFLNKVLQDKDYSLISLNGLTTDHFFNYKAEFEFIKAHYETYGVVPDRLTFRNSFEDFDIRDVAEPTRYLLSQLYKDYKHSYAATGINRISKLLSDDKVDEAAGMFEELAANMPNETFLSAVDLIHDRARLEHYKDKLNSPEPAYISTGLPELDKLIGGIDVNEEFMVVAARTGVGKSWIGILLAAAAVKAGKTVGYYSGEMSKDKVGYRLDTLLGNINNTDITRGYAGKDNRTLKNYESYFEVIDNNEHLGAFKIVTPSDLGHYATPEDLMAFVDKEHLDICIIDQVSLVECKSISANKPKWERVEAIIEQIKKIQVLKKIPVVALNQLNRQGEKDEKTGEREFDTTQLAGADAVGHFATTVLMLNHKQKEREEDGSTYLDLTIKIQKARDGGEGELHYAADFNTGDFKYIPSKHDAIDSDVMALRNKYEAKGGEQF